MNAGPTYEPIDPVRFIGNHSSGKMGVAIADAFADLGADVDLVLGPSHEKPLNHGIKIHEVQTASEMYQKCMGIFPSAKISVLSAAVADFTPSHKARSKIKKEDGLQSIELEATKDILLSLGESKKENQFLVGFALETDNERKNAIKKLKAKNLDMIVLNSLKDDGAGFGHSTNKISIIDNKENSLEFPLKDKSQVAVDIVQSIMNLLDKK